MARPRLDLAAIEASLREVQRNFARINAQLICRRDTLEDAVVANMMAGYRYVDDAVADGVDPLALGNSRCLLELNALVLCGSDPRERARERVHIAATEDHFYDQRGGGIGEIVQWYALHRTESPWKRAAGVYVRVLSEPQLYIEGNHRTGALIMSWLLAADGRPPFVLTVDNARAYFDPSTMIKSTKRAGVGSLFRLPRIKKEFAEFLKWQADRRYLMPGRACSGASAGGKAAASGSPSPALNGEREGRGRKRAKG